MKKLMENWRVWLEEPEPLLEYVVPMGYSLEAWKAHRKKHKITCLLYTSDAADD